ncbi:BTAD domain-containing putative transcriptional regulator [Actinocorallia longicatena]|uniref:nSTAND1 domain-containing NTPase n=1 Tax=Actinocorallia longicatena TaxID=111803 RepID=UPI0031D941F5
MEFRVLGTLQVIDGDGPVSIGNAHKCRLVLAALLARADRPAPSGWLVEAVWGDDPPMSAQRNLQLYLHRLRRTLGTETISRAPGGYTALTGGDLDALRFERLAAEARREPDDAEASELLRRALAEWRGVAFAEFTDSAILVDEAARLEQLRLASYESLAEAGLRLGRTGPMIPELGRLVREHPYREGTAGLYMAALYRDGRQAEALEVFRTVRARLAEELGVDPGPQLTRVHEAILNSEEVDLWPPPARRVTLPQGGGPYLGLATYQPEDSTRFFGRERLTGRLAELVGTLPLVGVFGASGSGKSSLIRAGLIARLAREDGRWTPVLFTPAERPLTALAAAVQDLTGESPDRLAKEILEDPGALAAALPDGGPRVLLVADQFEEAYTLCADDAERGAFIDALLAARGKATIVLGVRADFLARVSEHAGLVEALDGAQLIVGPPAAAELRAIATGPAERAGLTLEPALLAAVVADAGGGPGALPLVSHALLETWRGSRGRELSLAAYLAAKGVHGAVAETAERVYGELDPADQGTVRQIFLRLTALGDGTEDTRRPISRAELTGLAAAHVLTAILDRLAAEHLVVLGDDRVELGHEALIRAWPRLRGWLGEDRAELEVHRRLTQAARNWELLGRDAGALYRGAPLHAALRWAAERPGELNRAERTFLQTARAAEATEIRTVRRQNRRLTRLLAVGAAVLLLAVAAGAVALDQRSEAAHRQKVERAHQLALTARALLETDPDRAGLLAVEARRLFPDAETGGALISAASAAQRSTTLRTGSRSIWSCAFSPDGTRLAVSDSDGDVSVWDTATARRVALFTDHRDHMAAGEATYARALAFSRDGRLLAGVARVPSAGVARGSVAVWDLTAGRAAHFRSLPAVGGGMTLSPDGRILAYTTGQGEITLLDWKPGTTRTITYRNGGAPGSLAFSGDGRLLVSADGDGGPRIWNAATLRPAGRIDMPGAQNIRFDTGGRWLATENEKTGVRLWELAGGRFSPRTSLPREDPYRWATSAPSADRRLAIADENGLVTLWDGTGPVRSFQDRGRAETTSVALSSDGSWLASSGLGGTVILRRLGSAFRWHSGEITDLDASPDGRTIASSSADGSAALWDASGTLIRTFPGHRDRVEALAFAPDGAHLATVTRDHALSFWPTGPGPRLWERPYPGFGTSTDVAFQPAGSLLMTAAMGRHRWSVADPGHPEPSPLTDSLALITGLSYSPDGRVLATASPTGGLSLWDAVTDTRLRTIVTGQGTVADVAFAPGGGEIATAGADLTVRLWNPGTGAGTAVLRGHTAPVQAVAFSRDGRLLASAGHDSTIIVWDLSTRRQVLRLTGHQGRVQALAFTGSGDLVSGGADRRIIRWRLDPEAAATAVCAGISCPKP